MSPIQITVFTGYLGAGKTTTILSVLSQLPKDYKVVLLKNEYGDVEVDSKIAEQASITAVSEILNGCMCCILVGQMKNALLEIRDNYRPDRVVIESSGSALPATLALQIRQLEGEYPGDFKLDSIVTVIDAENFEGYEDQSPTAKLQAKFCDVILVNKWEHVSERQLDIVMDHLHTLNDLTPKLRCNERNGVSSDLIFGLDTKLYSLGGEVHPSTHMDEVETRTIWKGTRPVIGGHSHDLGSCCLLEHSEPPELNPVDSLITREQLDSTLNALSKESIYRVKGFVQLHENDELSLFILNWAFGRYDLVKVSNTSNTNFRLTVMGERGEVKRWAQKLAKDLQAHFA